MGLNFQIWAILLAMGLFAVARYAYRNTTPAIPRRLSIVLVSLRIVAFALIVFLMMDPRFLYRSDKREPARVIAMIDQSASMGLPAAGHERGESRFEAALGVSRELESAIKSNGGVYSEVFFSQDLVPGSADTLAPSGQGTDIDRSLARLYEKHDGEHLTALLLLSDGVETTTRLIRRQPPPLPVFAVGLGDTSAPEDVRIKDIDYNAIVRAPSRSKIAVSLFYSGESSKRVELRLSEGSDIVFRKDTVFVSGRQEIELEVPVEFTDPGRREFVLETLVEGHDEEAENNRRDVVIEAEKAGVRLLIVDLLPEWELHFLSEFLRNDQSFDFDLISMLGTQTAGSAGPDLRVDFLNRLAEYDALVLVSLTEAFMSADVTKAIRRFVEVDGKGLLVMPGHGSLFERAAAWARLEGLLPVRGTPPHRFNLRFTSVRPGAQAVSNPITSQLVPLLSQTDWQQRSPLLGFYTPLVPKLGGDVLLETVGQGLPAFTYQTVGKGRVAVISAGPLWRWKFLSDGNTMYDEMVSRLLDVLSRGEDTERFALFSKKNVYDSGEAPVITAELFDEKMQPVTGAPVRLEVSRLEADGREVPLDILSMQREGSADPRFRAELPGLQPGTYRLRGEAELTGRVVPSQAVDIVVSEVSVEFQRVAQDRSNLIRLANQSHGAYSTIDGAGAMVEQIDLEPRVMESTAEISLRTSVIMFGAILLLLAVEWVLRKRIGMV